MKNKTMITLYKGDCLEKMKEIESGSVDLILTDPPYGTTACKWDSVIPFEPMWEQLNRIIKPNGAIILFGSEPFSSALRMSNIKNYKYDWIWHKNIPTNFWMAKKMPMRIFEKISVFYKKQPTYNPIKEKRTDKSIKRLKYKHNVKNETKNTVYGDIKREYESKDKEYRMPTDVLKINMERKNTGEAGLHPTQKPVALMEYLIRTYTNENETVLDFTMGSGSTGVACVNTNRNFIGIEIDDEYFSIAEKRIENIASQTRLF